MSIKKLFESNNKVQQFVSDASSKDLFVEEGESLRNVEAKKAEQERYVPQVDYSKPENFARYGSARLYYKSALTRITDYYPYDGSEAEINEFLNGCLDVERYILDNQYPRTTGYISLNKAGYTLSAMQNGYASPTTNEYIDLVGGPGTGSAPTSKLKDLMFDPNDSKYNYSNIYDESIYTTAGLPTDYGSGTRTSNLRSDFTDGVTLEFWMKTGSVGEATTQKQVIFDMWNNELSSSANYGRLILEITGAAATTAPFRVSIASGSTVVRDVQLGNFAPSQFGDWKHYAIVLGSTSATIYVNGQKNDSTNYGSTIGALYQPNMVGRIGALVTNSIPATSGTERTGSAGAGRLSGSLDEFRFWKTSRTSKRNWRELVYPGAWWNEQRYI